MSRIRSRRWLVLSGLSVLTLAVVGLSTPAAFADGQPTTTTTTSTTTSTTKSTATTVPLSASVPAAPAAPATGNYGGHVLASGGGTGLAGVTIEINDGNADHPVWQQTTDSAGKFLFTDIPVGKYYIHFVPPADWITMTNQDPNDGTIVIDGPNDQLDVTYTAVPSVEATLHATMTFDQPTYRRGDTAHLTVTLTNVGSQELTGIGAACDHTGNPNELTGRGPGWGPLSIDKVTIPAGRSVRLQVFEPVPAEAYDWGYVGADCWFGPNPDNGGLGYPEVAVAAKVPGKIVNLPGSVTDHGKGIAGLKVYLRDHDTRAIVARAWTDSAGRFQFSGIPAGRYDLYLVGPWKPRYGTWPIRFDTAMAPKPFDISVLPGPNQPDPDPTTTTTAPPTATSTTTAAVAATGANKTSPLPSTGASVILPSIAGLAVLVAGVVLLLIGRRRRSTH